MIDCHVRVTTVPLKVISDQVLNIHERSGFSAKMSFTLIASETLEKLSELNTFQTRKTTLFSTLLIRLKVQGYRCDPV